MNLLTILSVWPANKAVLLKIMMTSICSSFRSVEFAKRHVPIVCFNYSSVVRIRSVKSSHISDVCNAGLKFWDFTSLIVFGDGCLLLFSVPMELGNCC
jgi:hypothetical protein